VAETVEAALGSMDARVETVDCPRFEDAPAANDAATLAELAAVLGGAAPVGPEMRAAIERARAAGLPAPERVRRLAFLGAELLGRPTAYARAWDARRRLAATTERLFERADVLATPTTPAPAPAFGEVTSGGDVRETLRLTAPFDNTGQPAVSVPCGEVDGRPVGLQFVAPAGADGLALAAAERFEQEVTP
jgi:Asp-tRNA(Asn)/Glu-tRNA(Gln) amidotransferase A subunit family amidase